MKFQGGSALHIVVDHYILTNHIAGFSCGRHRTIYLIVLCRIPKTRHGAVLSQRLSIPALDRIQENVNDVPKEEGLDKTPEVVERMDEPSQNPANHTTPAVN